MDNYLIQWYIGDVYSRLMNPEKALEYYKKALNRKEDVTSLLVSIGWEYYYLEDFDKASEYADRALKINENHYSADYLKTCINKRRSSIVEQVSEFIDKNYFYYKPNDKYQKIKNSLMGKSSVSVSDIEDLFNAARKDDDMFSFMLTGDDYKYYQALQLENTVEYKPLNETMDYIGISGFSMNTANDVLNIIDNLENSKDRYLVVDLRGNSGGYTASGADILDFLLPDSVVCNLIYRDGYSDAYYSDDELIEFKHIFVLVDEYSASCSELLTLGLKTYLDNVTVIGRKTFGKGVGQTLFEDKTNGFVIFLVNHYWNVRQENINEKGIIPDKTVKGDSLEEFMAVVSEEW
ncbi:MAG: tetratricopeptide repeat protein [Clostridiaceae bacterium]|nr:tetratricopeptide repeat protein [Clostridiaceae bacterium]